jgi:hypothetical protein
MVKHRQATGLGLLSPFRRRSPSELNRLIPSSACAPCPALRGASNPATIRTLDDSAAQLASSLVRTPGDSSQSDSLKPVVTEPVAISRRTSTDGAGGGKYQRQPRTNNHASTSASQARRLSARPRTKKRAGPAPFATGLDHRQQHNSLQKRRLRPRPILHTLNKSATAVHGTARAKEEDARGLVPLTTAPNYQDHLSTQRQRRAKGRAALNHCDPSTATTEPINPLLYPR